MVSDQPGPLLAAVAAGRADDVTQLLEHGADLAALDHRGIGPLHVAAAGGSSLLGELATSADVDLARVEATEVSFVPIVTRLLDAGADPNVRTRSLGLTPLMIATHFGQRDVANLLRTRGADAELRDTLGRTAERFAVFPIIARLIRLCRRLEMVKVAHLAQIHAPATHQFTSSVVGFELTAPLPGDAFASWPADEPLVAFGLGEDAVSRLVRLTPPVYARTAETLPRGPFTRTFTLHFDDPRPPYELKYALEKQTEVLLPLDRSTTTPLTFRGHKMFSGRLFDVTLVFEAVDATRTYSLHATASAAADRESATGFAQTFTGVESAWRAKLSSVRDTAPHSRGEGYAADVREAIAEVVKAAASRREDAAQIRALQKDVLDAMKQGKSLSTSHKDGGSEIKWEDGHGVFEEHDRVECFHREDVADPEEFLRRVRALYDWDIGRATVPHPPLEMDAWRYILGRLR